MKKRTILVSAFFLLLALAGILAFQLVSGGRSPGNLPMLLLLMVIGQSAQTIALVGFRGSLLRFAPLAAAIAAALWGTCLFLFAESWKYAAVPDLICGYVSPMLGCLAAVLFAKLRPSKY